MVELVARYLETYQYESALALARTLYAGEIGFGAAGTIPRRRPPATPTHYRPPLLGRHPTIPGPQRTKRARSGYMC